MYSPYKIYFFIYYQPERNGFEPLKYCYLSVLKTDALNQLSHLSLQMILLRIELRQRPYQEHTLPFKLMNLDITFLMLYNKSTQT